jgi:hypothetical protein
LRFITESMSGVTSNTSYVREDLKGEEVLLCAGLGIVSLVRSTSTVKGTTSSDDRLLGAAIGVLSKGLSKGWCVFGTRGTSNDDRLLAVDGAESLAPQLWSHMGFGTRGTSNDDRLLAVDGAESFAPQLWSQVGLILSDNLLVTSPSVFSLVCQRCISLSGSFAFSNIAAGASSSKAVPAQLSCCIGILYIGEDVGMLRRFGSIDIPLPEKSFTSQDEHEPSVKTESWPIVAKLGILFSILDVDVRLLLKLCKLETLPLESGAKEPLRLGILSNGKDRPPSEASRHASSSSMVDTAGCCCCCCCCCFSLLEQKGSVIVDKVAYHDDTIWTVRRTHVDSASCGKLTRRLENTYTNAPANYPTVVFDCLEGSFDENMFRRN